MIFNGVVAFSAGVLALTTTLILGAVPATTADPVAAKVKARCTRQWPGDYEMQLYCYNQQAAASKEITTLIAVLDVIADEKTAAMILTSCADKWADGDTYDYEMLAYCLRQQTEAYRALKRLE